jgi:hypothetical protein
VQELELADVTLKKEFDLHNESTQEREEIGGYAFAED